MGTQDKLKKLLDEIKNIITNPARFISRISLDGFIISDNLLEQMNSYFRGIYPANQDLIGITI